MIATAVILNGGDSASTTATVGPPAPRTVITTPHPPPSAQSPPSPPPETVTTLPSRSARPTAPPNARPTTPAPSQTGPPAVPPTPTLNPRTVFYRVTGTKQLFDFVTVVYTDARGLPQTDLNVALPWSKMIVLDPGVQITSVVATSLAGRLNCSITNAAGQTIITANNNTIIATCTH